MKSHHFCFGDFCDPFNKHALPSDLRLLSLPFSHLPHSSITVSLTVSFVVKGQKIISSHRYGLDYTLYVETKTFPNLFFPGPGSSDVFMMKQKNSVLLRIYR